MLIAVAGISISNHLSAIVNAFGLAVRTAWYRAQIGGADMRECSERQIETLLRGELVG